LNVFSCVTQVGHNVAYKVLPVLICHDLAIKIPRLNKIIVRMFIRLTHDFTRNVKGWFSCSTVRLRTAKAVGIIVRTITAVLVKPHIPVALVVASFNAFWPVNRQQQIIGSQSITMGIVVSKKTPL